MVGEKYFQGDVFQRVNHFEIYFRNLLSEVEPGADTGLYGSPGVEGRRGRFMGFYFSHSLLTFSENTE